MDTRDTMLDKWAMLCDTMSEGEGLTLNEKARGGWYRTRSIRSGAMLEIEAFPMPTPAVAGLIRRANVSSEAQKRLNRRNAEKRFRRLAEINFEDERDYYFTGTIEAGEDKTLPTLDEATHLFDLFIKRVNYHRHKQGMKSAKYLAVIEGWEEGSKQKRLHIHAIVEGGLDRNRIEDLWRAGQPKCLRLVHSHLDELCGYLMKDPRGRKRWKYSRNNLKEPTVSWADRKISAKAAWRVAGDVAGRSAALEKLYPGYKVETIEGHEAVEIRTNPYIPGVYLYARMRRIETAKERKERKKRWTR